jgi:tetratricopeptide (TPR) repeat protein
VLRWSYRLINVAPAALDMLGKIYLRESNVPAAMDCFREMVEYGDDSFLGPLEDERIYGGPAAAQGIVEQIKVLTDITPDYDAAIQLSYTLIERYDGVWKPCYENCWNYEEAAAYYITGCLRRKNAPLEDWETELRQIINRTKNEYLQASTLLTLGIKSQEFGDTGHAVQIYEEVVRRYPELYRVDEREIRGYSLEAFEKLEEIYKNQKDDEERLQEVRRKMRSHYERIYQIVMKNNRGYLGSFKHRFEKSVK